MTTKAYRPWTPDQDFLLPPRPREWLPEGHLVYFLLDVVEQLDLSAITAVVQERDPRGVVPFDPRMMTALLLYGYSRGIYSSRRLARATFDDVAVRFLAGGHHPHFTTIAGFRRNHLGALAGLFLQVLKLCQAAGLVKLGHVSLDGTKIQGNASKHSAMSYDRMKKDEERLAGEIAQLLERARQQDAEDDATLGEGQDDVDVPAELARREDRLSRIREARQALEQEAALARAAELRDLAAANDVRAASPELSAAQQKAAATRAAKQRKKADELDKHDDDDPGSPPADADALPRHAPAHDADGKPDEKAQRNFTDPDSRIMTRGGDVLQGYNGQAAVDADSHVIVACLLSNQPPDAEYFVPVLEEVEANLGRRPDKASADAGYWSDANAMWCEEQGIDAYIATQRQRHSDPPAIAGEAPPGTTESAGTDDEVEPKTDEPKQLARREKMREKLATREGHNVYRLRKCTPEPVFGNIKEARGFRRFLLRGIEKVRQEWAMVCTAHNLLKLFGAAIAA